MAHRFIYVGLSNSCQQCCAVLVYTSWTSLIRFIRWVFGGCWCNCRQYSQLFLCSVLFSNDFLIVQNSYLLIDLYPATLWNSCIHFSNCFLDPPGYSTYMIISMNNSFISFSFLIALRLPGECWRAEWGTDIRAWFLTARESFLLTVKSRVSWGVTEAFVRLRKFCHEWVLNCILCFFCGFFFFLHLRW